MAQRISRCQHQHSKSIKRHGRGKKGGLESRVLCLRDCSGWKGRSDSPFPSYVPKYQHSPGEGGTIGGYNTNSTRIVRGCEVWLSRAPGPGLFVFWPCSSIKLHLISLPLLLKGAGRSRRFSLSPFLVLQMKETAETERRFTSICAKELV